MRYDYKAEVRSFFRRNPEIGRYVRGRRRRFYLKLAVLEAVVLLVAAQIWIYGLPAQAVVVGVIAASVLPFPILEPFRAVGRGWTGEIVSVSEEMRRESSKHDPANTSTLRMGTVKKFLNCKVKCDDGKNRTFRVLALYGKVYRIGGRLLCIRGVDYPIPLDPKEHTVCPFCGGRMLTAVDHCAGCGAGRMDV